MGTVFLVRHGQASFGAADYDQLSELGQRQSQRLGAYLAAKGLVFEAAYTGTLTRHLQTYQALCQGAHTPEQATRWPGLNEFDGEAIIAAVATEPLAPPTTADGYRQHFRLLRHGLDQWMEGAVQPRGMPSYPEFVQGVTSMLDHIRHQHQGNVLVVSSGGPIATAVGHVLGTPAQATIELNFRIRNSAMTELCFTPRHHALLTFNTLPHLDSAEYAPWITYA